jgi:glyoxylase-like metal-dependent hydrolase (beta-lactamase superfamily II)
MTISRRTFLSSAALIPALRLTAHQAPPQPPPSVSFTPLRRDVGVFTGRGGTIGWLITPEAVVLVDSQFPDTAKLCLEGVKSRSKRQIDLLINTHHHGDHTAGTIVFKHETPHILAHENVPALQKKSAEERGNADQQAYADQTFGKTWDQDIGHERLQMRHYGPGHTGGDAVVAFAKANVVHMGDLVFRARHPFVDRPGGASVRSWLTTLEQVVKTHEKDTIYVFGHAREGLGVSGTAADLTAMRDYFSAVLDHVQKGIAAGQSRDAIVALPALPKFEDYPNSPATALAGVLGVAYDELTQK